MDPAGGDLYDEQTSKSFYDERYAEGYMDEWPPEKKRRVLEVIRSLGLPAEGEALDFGCGNGVFTEVMRRALPGWKVYGTDISTVAVENARRRVPGCTFFTQSDAPAGAKFDFLFTHHVLEHVYDLPGVWREMVCFAKPRSGMLHILPCGNDGSFEHRVCLLRSDGIDPAMENRFFFEDEGHVRRLSTRQLSALAAKAGFETAAEYYSNQHHGAVDWITRNEPAFVRMLTEPSRARDAAAREELSRMRRRLTVISALRSLRSRVRDFRGGGVKPWAVLLAGLALYPVSSLVDRRIRRRAEEEWERRKTDPAGSEMYLYFVR